MNSYPAVRFVARHGRALALAGAAVLAGIGLYGYYRTGAAEFLLGGAVCAAIGYGLLRVGAEVIEVIAETLLPR
ncbi:MAG: hypothetical protein HYU75_24695 [Betaproteobacteria bacterium]|nr:hypothetical protein [Betaproteobacteria bacterium]